MTHSQDERETAEPITAVVATRVRELRARAGLSQAALAERMSQLGRPWTRLTVVNLEKRGGTTRGSGPGRDVVTAGELLALAKALDVPLVWLLVDAKAGTPVPIAEGVEVDPWTALLWLTGTQPLDEPGGDAWASAYSALRPLVTLARLLESYRLIQRVVAGDVVVGSDSDPVEAGRDWEAAEASTLQSIANQLGQFHALQLPVPPVPADLRKRAAELGIELPGQEG